METSNANHESVFEFEPKSTSTSVQLNNEQTTQKEQKDSDQDNLDRLDRFLEQEKHTNSNEPWSKLDKTTKIKKLTAFAAQYASANQLSPDEHVALVSFFRECLDKKRLQRVKDVQYNKDTGEIKHVPLLHFNRNSLHFTLKNASHEVKDKHAVTAKKTVASVASVATASVVSDTTSAITANANANANAADVPPSKPKSKTKRATAAATTTTA